MLIHYLVCFLFFLTIETDGSLLNIERGLNEYVFTKKVPHYLVTAFNAMKLKNKISNNKLQCDVCKIVAQTAIDFRKNETDDEVLSKYFLDMCTIMWGTPNECKAELAIDIPSFLYILDNTKNLTAERICAILLQPFNCQDPNHEPWSIDIPSEISSERPQRNNTTSEELKVVHLTDIHYDPLYEAGRLSVGCESKPCCQNIHSKSNNSKTAAGYWGDYNACDTPWYAILDLFQQVVKQHSQIEMIYLTGDIISHQSWATSVEFNSECLRKVMNELKEQFKTIPIYPVLGNHDSYPSNVFSPTHVTAENISTQWLLDFVADEWSRWLPEETKSTIKKGGYYTVLAKTGFRIIGLNSNVCAVYNYWLIYNDQDPYDQLKWLVEVLLEAEKNNEVVHILSHIPANDADCWKQWSHQYRRIINRFSNTITAQFYGHTHSNEISVFYDFTNTDSVTNVAFTGGSFTGFSGGNPSYKIYNVESINYNVLDYEEWIYNLTEANQNPETNPRWYKLYSFKDAYGLESLDSDNLNKFIQNLSSNATILEQYRRFKVRDSPAAKSRCDKYCLKNIFCSATVGEFEESIQCKAFKNYFGIAST